MRPTTGVLTTYEYDIDGVPCHLIDTEGLDGSSGSQKRLLDEMISSDIIIWTVRANRPAREPDRRLMQEFDEWFQKNDERRRPKVIAVATSIDELAGEQWPFPEHALPENVQKLFAEAVRAIAKDVSGMKPVPVRAKSPEWNVSSVSRALAAVLADGLQTQRNRIRIEAQRRDGGAFSELMRSGRGVFEGSRTFGERLLKRTVGENSD